jgi:hypothetical protein
MPTVLDQTAISHEDRRPSYFERDHGISVVSTSLVILPGSNLDPTASSVCDHRSFRPFGTGIGFTLSTFEPGFLETPLGIASLTTGPDSGAGEGSEPQPIEARQRPVKTRTEARLLMVALLGSRRRGEPCPMTKHATPRERSSYSHALCRRMQAAGRSVLVRADDFAARPSAQCAVRHERDTALDELD